MKILITGGLGNLGSWLTRHFSKAGHSVAVLSGRRRQLTEALNYEWLQADVSNEAQLKQVLENRAFDVVIHAASVNEVNDEGYARKALEVNTWGTRVLLDTLKDVKHFVYLSTFHVYGAGQGNITEETPVNPKNDYALTHLFAEYYVKKKHMDTGLPYTIIRLSNSYGCPMDKDSSKWYLILNDLAKMAFAEKKIVLKSNGLAARDFIWMGAVCDAMEQLAAMPATNDTYNLSSGTCYSLMYVARAVQAAAKTYGLGEIAIEYNKADKTPAPKDLIVSSEKLKNLIEYDTTEKFEEEAIYIFTLLS